MRNNAAIYFILISLIMICLVVPVISAAVPDIERQAGPVGTSPDLNVTGANVSNYTIPYRYEKTPKNDQIKISISDTYLPASKGEMAAGPRTIGFFFNPISLAIAIIAIVAGAAGVWYVTKRKQNEPDDDE
jgi:hypothetical protein